MDTNSKQLFFIILILFVAGVAVYITLWPKNNPKIVEVQEVSTSSIKKVRLNDDVEVSVIVADTESARQKGLSGSEMLETNTGMLFVFEKPGKFPFWMKDMNYPLDIIWISENHSIVHIERSVSPDTYPQFFASSKNALYVLEVSAGFVDAHGLEIADQADFL